MHPSWGIPYQIGLSCLKFSFQVTNDPGKYIICVLNKSYHFINLGYFPLNYGIPPPPNQLVRWGGFPLNATVLWKPYQNIKCN